MTEHTPASAPGRAADPGWFRRVLGQYPTGVSVVTGIAPDATPAGLAVGSFTSVSLDPPLVAFLPDKGSGSWPKIHAAGSFCVNILAEDQEHVCRAFASKAADKFAGLGWRTAGSGSPILDDAVAWVDCDLEAVHEAGDHLIVIGRVRDLDVERPTLPLLFFQGGYGRFSPRSLAIRDTRFGAQLQLLDRARPLMEALSRRTGAQLVAAHCDGNELTLLASVGAPPGLRAPSAAAIGQRLPVTAPVGIWWMAYSDDTQVERWLEGAPSPDLQARYRRALAGIRERGYCLGLGSVHGEIDTMISSRPGPGGKPTDAERARIAALSPDPLDYVPCAGATAGTSRAEVVSLWAPTFTPDGKAALRLMLTGHPSDDRRPPYAHAEDLLALARDVTYLAAR